VRKKRKTDRRRNHRSALFHRTTIKIRHLGTIAQLCRAISSQLRHRQSEKKLVKQQYLPHMSLQYGELRPTNGWDRFVSLGHPSSCQRVSRLGSVTAWHSSSGRQRNFAALNRGRHLYSAGRRSGWALVHILVAYLSILFHYIQKFAPQMNWNNILCSRVSTSTLLMRQTTSGAEDRALAWGAHSEYSFLQQS